MARWNPPVLEVAFGRSTIDVTCLGGQDSREMKRQGDSGVLQQKQTADVGFIESTFAARMARAGNMSASARFAFMPYCQGSKAKLS